MIHFSRKLLFACQLAYVGGYIAHAFGYIISVHISVFLASCTCLFLPLCVFRYIFCLVMYRVNSVVMAVCSFPWYICVLRVTRHLWPFWFSFRRLYSAA